MMITTTGFINDKTLKSLGMVFGSSIKTRNFVRDFIQCWRGFFGLELKAYVDAQEAALNAAVERMILKAKKMGADAVVSARVAASNLAEVFVYGTAVQFV